MLSAYWYGMYLKLFGLPYEAGGQMIMELQEFILFNELRVFSFNSLV